MIHFHKYIRIDILRTVDLYKITLPFRRLVRIESHAKLLKTSIAPLLKISASICRRYKQKGVSDGLNCQNLYPRHGYLY